MYNNARARIVARLRESDTNPPPSPLSRHHSNRPTSPIVYDVYGHVRIPLSRYDTLPH